jgi:hypothetical protein
MTTRTTTSSTPSNSTTRTSVSTSVGLHGVGFSVQHGSRELTALTTGCTVVMAVGVGSSVSPVLELAVTWLIALALTTAAAVAGGRRVRRWTRERVEDRMDTAYAAAHVAAVRRARELAGRAGSGGSTTGSGGAR